MFYESIRTLKKSGSQMIIVPGTLILLIWLASIILPCRVVLPGTIVLSLAFWMFVFIAYRPEAQAACMAAITLAIVFAFVRQGSTLQTPGLPVVLLVVLANVSAIFMSERLEHLAANLIIFAYQIVLIFAVASAPESLSMFANLVAPVVILVQVASGVREVYMGADALWPRHDGVTRRLNAVNHLLPEVHARALGSLGYSITVGITLGICALFCLWAATQTTSRWRRHFYLLCVAAALFGMLLAGSRMAVLACILSLIFWASLVRGIHRPFMIYAVVPMGIWMMTGGAELFLSTIGFTDDTHESQSLRHRLGVFETSVGLFGRGVLSTLIGDGANGGQIAFQSGTVVGIEGIGVFDNQYLRTLAVSGVVGLLALLGAFVYSFWKGAALHKVLLLFFAVVFISYDALTWQSLNGLFLLACASAARGLTGPSWSQLQIQTRPNVVYSMQAIRTNKLFTYRPTDDAVLFVVK